MDEWLEKYRREYESLPPLASIPESEREDELHRREEIRKALYALPDAPKPSELSDLEKKVESDKADLKASWVNDTWCPEDQAQFHFWWRDCDFAEEYLPEFNDKTLARKSANLVLLIKKNFNSVVVRSDRVSPKNEMIEQRKDGLSVARQWTIPPSGRLFTPRSRGISTFASLSVAFNQQYPLSIYCVVRTPSSDLETMVHPEWLVRSYGNPFEESLGKSADGEVQQVLLFSDCLGNHQTLDDWRGFSNEAGSRLIERGLTNNAHLSHSPAAEWVLACSRVLRNLKTDFVDQEGFDQSKGLVYTLQNAWGMSSLVCLELAMLNVPEVAAAGQESQVVQYEDGLFEDGRILIWGGVRFTLTPNQTLAFKLLVDAYPGDVTDGAFKEEGLGALRDSFRFSSKERKKRGYDYYPGQSHVRRWKNVR